VRVITKVINAVLSVGDVAVFGGATARLRFSREFAIHSLSASLEQTLYISNLMEFFGQQPQMVSGSGVLHSPPHGEIHIKHVSFTYPGSTEPALNDVSLHIHG
jgi:ABC-type multidrug transport system fused ATPase/permease subunit